MIIKYLLVSQRHERGSERGGSSRADGGGMDVRPERAALLHLQPGVLRRHGRVR